MMEQILRIFRKDVRHLWPGILVVIALIVAHAVLDVRSDPAAFSLSMVRINQAAGLLSMLLPLGIWYLVAQLIFQEALPGDRQFWLTRPYRWLDLLASKVLFAAVFISIPLFASDCYILGIQGFAVLGVVPEILLRQLMIGVLFILPVFAIASVTTALPQFVLAVFLILLALVSEVLLVARGPGVVSVGMGSGPAVVVAYVVILAGVVIWQYAKRRTTAARLFLLIATFTFLPGVGEISRLPWFRPERRTLPASPKGFDVRFDYDLNRSPSHPSTWQEPPDSYALAYIPLSVSGLPPNTLLRGRAEIQLEAGGKAWPEPGSLAIGLVKRDGGEYWQELGLPKSAVSTLSQNPVSLRTTFYLNIVNDQAEETLPPLRGDSRFAVPNLGHCHIIQTSITCRAGLEKAIETTLRLQSPGAESSILADVSASTIPWGLSPTSQTLSVQLTHQQWESAIAVVPRRQLAEFQRSLAATDIRLSRYLVPQQHH